MQSALKEQSTLHIVCFDNPYPPDYGGVIDIYYKIKSLHELGIKIILHVFIYGKRQPSQELTAICNQVYYYKRARSVRAFFSMQPFIVKTRIDKKLLINLLKDNNPILLEGLHCTAFLKQLINRNRKVSVRCHNIEHHYYQHLSYATRNPLKWFYFKLEAYKLKHYESVLASASLLYAISPADHCYLDEKFKNSQLLPAFHPFLTRISSSPGHGKYLLFHANLSVLENEKSMLYLLDKILTKTSYPIIIAGQSPSNKIKLKIKQLPHIKLVENPSSIQMSQLIENAQIILLHSHQETGMKLKLIYSLFQGRHVICNSKIVNNTGLEKLCHIANDENQWLSLVNKLWEIEFPESEIQERQQILATNFDQIASAKMIINTLINPSL